LWIEEVEMVTLVTTIGNGAMDFYARKFAENLDVPKIYSDIYHLTSRDTEPISTEPPAEIGFTSALIIRASGRRQG